MRCGISKCEKTYSTWGKYYSHLREQHKENKTEAIQARIFSDFENATMPPIKIMEDGTVWTHLECKNKLLGTLFEILGILLGDEEEEQ